MSETHDYSAYKEKPVVGDNMLATLAGLANDQLQVEARIARLESELDEAKVELRQISENQIPELMETAGIEDFTTRDGVKINITEKIMGSIPKATQPQAFLWLEENGQERLIKRQFVIDFGKDDEKWASKFERDLAQRKRPLNSKCKRAVNPQTLQAFVREQLAKGVAIPMDTFGVFRRRASKVTVKE